MSIFELYPAIDLRGGRVVRLQEGDPARMTSYSDDPAATARRWLDAGADWLHVVNLDGAFGENDAANRAALDAIAKVTAAAGARIQFGGGLRSADAVRRALDAGVSRAVIGTLAVESSPVVEYLIVRFGPKRIAVAIDARDGWVQVRGWGTASQVAAADLARRMRTLGLETVVFTDIRRDGMGSGLNFEAARAVAGGSGLDVIAAGGASSLTDLLGAQTAGLAGAILGRALYDGTLDLEIALKEVALAREADHPVS